MTKQAAFQEGDQQGRTTILYRPPLLRHDSGREQLEIPSALSAKHCNWQTFHAEYWSGLCHWRFRSLVEMYFVLWQHSRQASFLEIHYHLANKDL